MLLLEFQTHYDEWHTAAQALLWLLSASFFGLLILTVTKALEARRNNP